MLKITEEMRAAAGRLLRDRTLKSHRSDRDLLVAISDGKRKLIRAEWWGKFFKTIDQQKLDKLQRKKPRRTGDRHLDKSDRHAPGYMRDYMRRRRAKLPAP